MNLPNPWYPPLIDFMCSLKQQLKNCWIPRCFNIQNLGLPGVSASWFSKSWTYILNGLAIGKIITKWIADFGKNVEFESLWTCPWDLAWELSFGIYRIWPKNTRKIRHEYPTLASWINHDQELFPWSCLTSIRYMGDFGLHVEAGLVRSYCVYRNGFEGTFWIGNECESLLNEDSIHLNRNIFPIFWDFFVNSPICLPHRNFHHALTQEISCDACTLGTPRDVLSWSNSKRQRLLIHGKIVMWRW